MKLVDDHCHLNHEKFKDDLDEVIKRAKEAGVVKIIAAGVNPPTNREVLELTKKYPGLIECAFGAYPIDALNIQVEALDDAGLRQTENFDLDAEIEWIKQNKDGCVAIGEVGLDYKWIKEPEQQKKMRENFAKMIELCEKINKPIVVHSRRAERDCVDMLISSKLKKVVLHCFEGRKSLIKQAADAGFYFSVPTVIQRLQHFETLAKMVNINQILTETDAPWLSPVANERNEPANVIYIIKKIAAIKEFTEEETANNILMNYQQVYG